VARCWSSRQRLPGCRGRAARGARPDRRGGRAHLARKPWAARAPAGVSPQRQAGEPIPTVEHEELRRRLKALGVALMRIEAPLDRAGQCDLTARRRCWPPWSGWQRLVSRSDAPSRTTSTSATGQYHPWRLLPRRERPAGREHGGRRAPAPRVLVSSYPLELSVVPDSCSPYSNAGDKRC
jgi:hypothetical protein